MPSLRDLKNRIASVKSTQKITSAMKMVAVSKLRRAQQQVENNRLYAERMLQIIQAINLPAIDSPKLMRGSGKNSSHLLIVITSDKGLCGGLNSSLIRKARTHIETLQQDNKTVKIWCLGRKGRELLAPVYGSLILAAYQDIPRHSSPYSQIQAIAQAMIDLFEQDGFDVATLFYSEFQSILVQKPRQEQLIPLTLPATPQTSTTLSFEFEPNEQDVLTLLVPLSLKIQMYRCLLETLASEQGARITAMDNATRNAGEMLANLTLFYNRLRQSHITKELIEIISGAEAIA